MINFVETADSSDEVHVVHNLNAYLGYKEAKCVRTESLSGVQDLMEHTSKQGNGNHNENLVAKDKTYQRNLDEEGSGGLKEVSDTSSGSVVRSRVAFVLVYDSALRSVIT